MTIKQTGLVASGVINYGQDYNFTERIFMFDSLVNLFCIFILFGFSSSIYYKLCNTCDKRAKQCYVETIMKKQNENGASKLTQDQQIQLTQLVTNSC